MLYGISPLISPHLMTVLMEMGHGDEIVFADAHFPGVSHARRLVRADGLAIPQLLKAVLPLFPLDRYVQQPVALMRLAAPDTVSPPIWEEYQSLLRTYQGESSEIMYLDRETFYQRSCSAFAIVVTGEMSTYGNILLKKGVVEGLTAEARRNPWHTVFHPASTVSDDGERQPVR